MHTDQTMGTTQSSRRNIFKFLTPLTASVEKTVQLHGFKKVDKPWNINIWFSQTAWQHITSEVIVKGVFKKYCTSTTVMRLMIYCGMTVKRMVMLGVWGRWRHWIWSWRQWHWLVQVN